MLNVQLLKIGLLPNMRNNLFIDDDVLLLWAGGGSWYHDTASCLLTCKIWCWEDPPTFGTDTNLYLAYFHQGPTPICEQTGPDSTINCRKCRNFSNECVRIKHINHLSRFEKYKSTFHILLYIKFHKNNKSLQVKITL